MSDLSDRLWSKGFYPNVGEPWTLEDHERVRQLQAENERLTEAFDLADGLRKAHQAEIMQLIDALKDAQTDELNLRGDRNELRKRVEALEGAIRWALGESPEGMPEFPLIGEPPYYRWRTQLRLLADLPYIAATEQGESDD